MGWSVQFFNSLPHYEKEDWLAHAEKRRKQLSEMIRGMNQLAKDGKAVDGGAYATIWLALMET